MIYNLVCFASVNSEMSSAEQEACDFFASKDESSKWVIQLEFVNL